MISRRSFLSVAPLGVLLGSRLTPSGTPALAGGVQLYTVRESLARDLYGTLETLAEIGFKELELWGVDREPVGELRMRLDDLGLRAASSHVSIDQVRGDWEAVVTRARELGQSLIVVPSIPNDEQGTDALMRIAEDFNGAGEVAREFGVRFGYHNHQWELEARDDGTIPMDLLLTHTEAGLVDWQMDVYWTVDAGADPIAWLRRAQGRVSSVHVKDRTADARMVDVGDGVIDFGAFLPRAQDRGLQHVFVEHDRPDDPMSTVRRGLEHLRRLGVVS